ncbi:MAG: hypothetical protein D6785_13655, partial [Planctomycetota bacterium]
MNPGIKGKQLIKISILGMPLSGRKTFLQGLFHLGILEGMPQNKEIGFMDTPFCFQPARISGWLEAKRSIHKSNFFILGHSFKNTQM